MKINVKAEKPKITRRGINVTRRGRINTHSTRKMIDIKRGGKEII
jgi:hypothetical protein